ncbi:MAG: hypothetical protein P8L32_06325, partial [Paracoccaceae bacterium]|nr:hypothetical protein [Paracoccaceae bacterium]
MMKEHSETFAEVIVVFFAVLIHRKTLLWASAVTCEFELTGLALFGQPVAFVRTKIKLPIGPNHIA